VSTACTVEAGTPTSGAIQGWPELAGLTQLDDSGLDLDRGLAWQPVSYRRTITRAVRAFPAPTAQPPVTGCPRAVQLRRDVRDRPAILNNTTYQLQTAVHRQPGISVRHRSLQSTNHAVNNGHGHYT